MDIHTHTDLFAVGRTVTRLSGPRLGLGGGAQGTAERAPACLCPASGPNSSPKSRLWACGSTVASRPGGPPRTHFLSSLADFLMGGGVYRSKNAVAPVTWPLWGWPCSPQETGVGARVGGAPGRAAFSSWEGARSADGGASCLVWIPEVRGSNPWGRVGRRPLPS